MQALRELWHELRGTISPAQREAATALRREKPPRSPELARAIARLHAPWWGFAAYFAVYAMTVMAIVAAFGTSVVQLALPSLDWVWLFWISAVLTAPLSSIPFRKWVARRRSGLVDIARDGEVIEGVIVETTEWRVRGGAHSTQLTIASSAGTFRGYVGRRPRWAQPEVPVGLVALPTAQHAVLLAPDVSTRPLTRA